MQKNVPIRRALFLQLIPTLEFNAVVSYTIYTQPYRWNAVSHVGVGVAVVGVTGGYFT